PRTESRPSPLDWFGAPCHGRPWFAMLPQEQRRSGVARFALLCEALPTAPFYHKLYSVKRLRRDFQISSAGRVPSASPEPRGGVPVFPSCAEARPASTRKVGRPIQSCWIVRRHAGYGSVMRVLTLMQGSGGDGRGVLASSAQSRRLAQPEPSCQALI